MGDGIVRRPTELPDERRLQVEAARNNDELMRKLMKGSIQRAIQENVAAVVILIAFASILAHSDVGSPGDTSINGNTTCLFGGKLQ